MAGRSRHKYLCPGCCTMGYESSHQVCHYCTGEFVKIKKVQEKIVARLPRMASVSPSELFRRLWEAQEKGLSS